MLKKGLSSSKHSGVKALFNEHFVKTGLISLETGRFFSSIFEFRQKGDYSDFVTFEVAKVAEWLQQAENQSLKSSSYFLPMKYVTSKKQKEIKNIDELGLDFNGLVNKMNSEKGDIERARFKANSRVKGLFETDFINKLDKEISREEIVFIKSDEIVKALKKYEIYDMKK